MEQLTVVELLVDAGEAVVGAEKLIAPLERVATAATKAAESVNLLGTALDRASSRSGASGQALAGMENLTRATVAHAEAQRGAAASGDQTDAALVRQGAAAQNSAAIIARLTATLQQVAAAQTNLKDSMLVGNADGARSSEMVAIYAERIRQLESAIAALKGGASSAEVMERFPKAFAASAHAAELTSSAFVTTAKTTRELAETMLPLDAAISRIRAGFTTLVEKYDPATTSTRTMMREIGQLGEAFQAGQLSAVRYSEIFGQITAAQNEASLSARRNADIVTTLRQAHAGLHTLPSAPLTTDVLAQKQASSDAQFVELAASAQKVRDQLDPAGAAFARYNTQVAQYGVLLNTVDPKTKQAFLSQDEYNKAVRRAADEHQGAVASLHTMGAAMASVDEKTKETTKSQGLNRAGSMELRAAGVNAFQALAAGMNPLFVAQMEGAQVVGAVIQGTKITLAQVLTTLGPIVALAAGVAAIAIHAVNAAADLRSFNLQLSTIALTAGGPTAAGLKSLQDHLRDTGSTAADAKKMIDTVIQAAPRGLNPNAAREIIPLARNIAAGRGTEAPEETTKLTAALTGGVDEMIKYGFELNALSAPQAVLMRELNEQGRAADAMRIALSALSATYSGTFDRSLTESQKILLELKQVWNDTLDSLMTSGFFQWLIDQLKGVVDGVRTTIDEFKRLYDLVPQFLKDMAVPVKPGSLFGSATTATPGVTAGSGIASFDTRGLDISGGDLPRLATVLGEGSKALPTGFSLIATSTTGGRHAENSAHYQAGAMDVQVVGPNGPIPNKGPDTTGYYTAVMVEAYLANQKMFPGTVFDWGNVFETSKGSGLQDIMHAQARPAVGNLGTPLEKLVAMRAGMSGSTSTSATAADAERATTAPDIEAAQQKLISTNNAQRKSVADLAEENRKALVVDKEVGAQKRLAEADLAALNKANQLNLLDDGKENLRSKFLAEEHAHAVAKIANENRLAADASKLEADGTIKTAQAYQQSTVEGLKAAAMTQAVAQSRSGVISVEQAYNQIIVKNATDAIASAAAQARAMNPVIEGNARIAEATLHGTAAQRLAEITNDAIARSQDAVNKAQATGIQSLIDLAQATEATNIKQALANETLKQTTALRASVNQSKDQEALVQLETSLQGQRPEIISAQLSVAREMQRIKNDSSLTSEADKQAALDQAVSLANANIALVEAQRHTQQINQAMQQVGQTIESELTHRISDAFDGKKAESWGETMRSILKSLIVQITEFAFIRPLIGSVLGAIGFGQAAQGFGSLFGLGGGGGAGAAGVAGATGGGLDTGTLLQGAGLAKDAFGGSLFGEGGFSGFLNNIGTNLGFASSATAGSLGSGASVAASLGSTPFSALPGANVASFLTGGAGPSAATAASTGGLFGATTFSSFLGGAGAGFGAGTLLNSLIGGNQLTGTVGSGLGSAAGAAIGSILFPGIGTLLGGLLGGSGGGLLGGIFGNNKPSTLASGALLDLATGKVGDFSSSGNQQNDAQVKQISSSIGTFASSVQKLTGGTVDGSLNVVATTKGIETHYSGSLGKIDAKFADAESAIKGLELAIAQNLTGISDTLKTALAHITDPSQVQAAVTFAATYDDIKKAADSAFSSISSDVKTIGPFQTALENLNKTFKDLSTQATEFGLALDPINAGLQEATKRLQKDFTKALDQALNQASGNEFIDQLTGVSQDFATNSREAMTIGLGGDETTTAKIAQLESLQAQKILSGLNGDQLQNVVEKFAQTNPEISAMAQAILSTGTAALIATSSINDLSSGIKSLQTLATSLRTGPLSGLPPAQQAQADTAAYFADLRAVQSAGQNVTSQQLTDLASSGQAAIEASKAAFGEAPQTADLRKKILASLDAVTGTTGLGAPTTAAAAAAAQAQNLSSLPAVQAAQAAAAAAALAGVTSKVVVPNPTPANPIIAGIQTAPPSAPGGPATTVAASAAASPPASSLSTAVSHYLAGIATKDEQEAVTLALNSGQIPTSASAVQAAWNNIYQHQVAGSFASGTDATPPGLIMVGEGGPELVYQRGGLSVTPISAHPSWSWRGGSSGAGGEMAELVGLMRSIHAELTAHGEQRRAIAVETLKKDNEATGLLDEIATKVGAPVGPGRQKLTAIGR